LLHDVTSLLTYCRIQMTSNGGAHVASCVVIDHTTFFAKSCVFGINLVKNIWNK
jgi:hypothetical protein